MRKILIPLAMAALLAPLVLTAQTTSIAVTYTWSAPTTGSPVHHYVVQTSSNGTTWTTITAQPTTGTVTIQAPVGVQLLIHVAGVDQQGRQGTYSDPSDSFTPDAGAPGACGKPMRV